MEWKSRFAARIAHLGPSQAVVEILKLAERDDVISFAGGLPDPATFQLEHLRESAERVLRDEGAAALNYGPNPGYSKLRGWLAERMRALEGVSAEAENILVTSGGLEALHLIAIALLEPGSTVLVAAPTYLAALHVFRASRARIVSIPVDGEGMDAEALQERVLELEASGIRPSLLYCIPSFQNPSGLTMSLRRRQRIVEICRRHAVPIVEDHAYAELRYEGQALPSLKSLAPEQVVFIHTFSKIFGPGARLGWVVAAPELIRTLGLCKLGTDQCPNTLTQRLVYDFGSRGWIEEQVRQSLDHYRRKRDQLLTELSRGMPADVSWTQPQGGFYVWMTLAAGADSEALLRRAVEKEKVAFVAGPPFFHDGSGAGFLRLSFSFIAPGQIREGVQRLSRLLRSTTGN